MSTRLTQVTLRLLRPLFALVLAAMLPASLIAQYGPNLLTNGNFETYTSGLANGWTMTAGSTVYTVSQDSGQSGYAQKVDITSSPSWGLVLHQNPGLQLGVEYELRVTYKTSGSQSIKAEVADINWNNVELNKTLPGTNGSWREEVFYFTHNNASANLVRIAASAVGAFWIDGISLLEAYSLTTYQAEDYSSVNNCVVATNWQGYTGAGFMDYGSSGTWVEWNNVSGNGGAATVTFRYSNGGSATRQAQLLVNGVSAGTLNFAQTPSWNDWSTVATNVSLNAGNNTLRLVAVTSGPNLDSFDVETAGGGGGPDTQAPSVPANLAASNVTSTTVDLDWDASTDNVAVTGYNLYINGGSAIDVGDDTSITVTQLSPNTNYTFKVSAYDAAQNESAQSAGVNVKTSAAVVSWEDAVATRDFDEVEAWYAENTGHEALGYSVNDLTYVSQIVSQYDGQVFEGLTTGIIKIAHNNVTVRGCRITTSDGQAYGSRLDPTTGSSLSGIVIEYCTFVGPGGNPLKQGRAAYINTSVPGGVVMRNCNIYGFTSGIGTDGGLTVEYTWVHDLAQPDASGAHRTSLRGTGSNITFYRNYATDGGSSCISAYFDKREMDNVLIQENILNGSSPNASPSYLINMKNGTYALTAENIKMLNNMFGPEYQYGVFSGVNVTWGVDGNERCGNEWFLTGVPVANDVSCP